MNCQSFEHNIQKYFSADLSAQELKAFEAHLTACGGCQKVLAQERLLEQALKASIKSPEAPQDLRMAVLSSMEQQSSGSNVFTFFSKPAWTVGLASLAVVLVVFVMMGRSSDLYAQAAQYRQAVAQKESSVLAIRSSNMNEVLGWLNHRLDNKVGQPHLDLAKVRLIGASIVDFHGRDVAHFVYEKDGQTISAFAMPADVLQTAKNHGQVMFDGENEQVTADHRNGFEDVLCFHKKTKDGCLFVSNIPREEFVKLMG